LVTSITVELDQETHLKRVILPIQTQNIRSETNASDNNDDGTDSKASLVDTLTTDSDLEVEPEGYDTCSLAFAIQVLDKTCAWLESEDSMFCGYRSKPSLLTKVKQNGASRRKGKKQGERYPNRAHLFFGKSRRNNATDNGTAKTVERKETAVVDETKLKQQGVNRSTMDEPTELKMVSPFARPRRISKKVVEKSEEQEQNIAQPEKKSPRQIYAYKNTVSEEKKAESGVPSLSKANSFRKFMIERPDDRNDNEILESPNSQTSNSVRVILASTSRKKERNLEPEAKESESLLVPILEQTSAPINETLHSDGGDNIQQHLQQEPMDDVDDDDNNDDDDNDGDDDDDQQLGSSETMIARNNTAGTSSIQVDTVLSIVSSTGLASAQVPQVESVVSQRDEEEVTKTEEASEVRDESVFTEQQSNVEDDDDESEPRLDPPEHITTDPKDAVSVTYSTVTDAVYSISKFASKEQEGDEDGNDFVMLSREQIIKTTPDSTVVEQPNVSRSVLDDDDDDDEDDDDNTLATNNDAPSSNAAAAGTDQQQHDTLAQFSTEVTLSPTSNERIISPEQQHVTTTTNKRNPVQPTLSNKAEKKLNNSITLLSHLMKEQRKPLDIPTPLSSSSFLSGNSDHDSTSDIIKNHRKQNNNISTTNTGQHHDDERSTALLLAEKLRRRATALKQRRKNRTTKRFLQSSNDYDSGGTNSPTHSIDSFPGSPTGTTNKAILGISVATATTTTSAVTAAATSTGRPVPQSTTNPATSSATTTTATVVAVDRF
jgi:hypothetical protein